MMWTELTKDPESVNCSWIKEMTILQERSDIEWNEASLGLKVNTREYLFYVGNGLKVYRYSGLEKDLIDSDNGQESENFVLTEVMRLPSAMKRIARWSNTSTWFFPDKHDGILCYTA